jgi:hypothetical protein
VDANVYDASFSVEEAADCPDEFVGEVGVVGVLVVLVLLGECLGLVDLLFVVERGSAAEVVTSLRILYLLSPSLYYHFDLHVQATFVGLFGWLYLLQFLFDLCLFYQLPLLDDLR